MLLKRRSRCARSRAAKACSARRVVGKRVTDFLDLNEVIQRGHGEPGSRGRAGPQPARRILVAEASAFSRGLIRSGLDMAGYRVVEAANLRRGDSRAGAATGRRRGGGTGPAAQRQCRSAVPPCAARPEWERIPVLALAESDEQLQAPAAKTAGFQDCQAKFDREGMLESVARLASALASAELAADSAWERRDRSMTTDTAIDEIRTDADQRTVLNLFRGRLVLRRGCICACRKCCASSR